PAGRCRRGRSRHCSNRAVLKEPTMRTRPAIRRKPDTRRPAGLPGSPRFEVLPLPGITDEVPEHLPAHATVTVTASPRQGMSATIDCAVALALRGMRSEEHTSELQSRFDLVCRLLLEKKKQHIK